MERAQFEYPRIIGLVGPSGAGKSWTAAALARCAGYAPIHIGDPLKEIAMVFGFERHEVYGTAAEKEAPNAVWGISGRHFMQHFGTDLIRDRLPFVIPEMRDTWIQCMRQRIVAAAPARVVVDGIRFQDEIDAIRALGGKSYFIHHHARGHALAAPLLEKISNQHVSETRLDELVVDGTLHNNGTDGGHIVMLLGPPPPRRRVSPKFARIVAIIAVLWGVFLYHMAAVAARG